MSLIKIIKDGRELILFPGTKIKFVLKSPLFVYEPSVQSSSLSFRIPAEPNDTILDFVRLTDKRNKSWVSDNWQIYIDGSFWKIATIKVTGIFSTEYQIQLLLDKGYVASSGQKSIKNFEYNKLGLPHRFMYSVFERDNYVFTFNVEPATYSITLNLQESGSTTRIYVFTLQQDETLIEFAERAASEINANYGVDKFFAYCPFGSLEICYYGSNGIFSTTFSESSADVSAVKSTIRAGSLDTQAKYITKLVNETVDADDFIYFGVKNPGFFGDDITIVPSIFRSEWRNPMFPQASPVTDWFLVNQATANSVTPFPFLYNILKMIHKELGFEIDDQLFDDELKTLTIYSTYDQCTVYEQSGSDLYFISLFFKLKDVLPDITLSSLLNSVGNMFCSIFDFNSSSMKSRWIKRKDILEYEPDSDWSYKVDVNYEGEFDANLPDLEFEFDGTDQVPSQQVKSIDKLTIADSVDQVFDLPTSNIDYNVARLVKAENKYYITKRGSSWPWEFYSENLFKYKNTGNTTINVKTAPLCSTVQDFSAIGGLLWNRVLGLYPYVNQAGQSQFEGAQFLPFSLRLMFWRGIVPASLLGTAPAYTQHSTYNYPLGHYHNLDYNNNVIGEYSLSWDGDAGLKSKFWNDWLNYLSQLEQYQWYIPLNSNDLLNLDLLRPKRIKNQLYFIDTLEVNIGDTIEVSKLTTYKR